eukprot:SAG31_NODE_4960_length_2834_cov_2.174040_2_plen_67_part_00
MRTGLRVVLQELTHNLLLLRDIKMDVADQMHSGEFKCTHANASRLFQRRMPMCSTTRVITSANYSC